MWWVIAVSVAACLVLLYLNARWNERRAWRDWELVLSPKGERVLRAMEGRVEAQLEFADLVYRDAHYQWELGSMDEARRLVRRGYDVLAAVAPTMLRLLAAMAVFVRMVDAIAPVPALRPRQFRVTGLMSLAFLSRVVHGFLQSGLERFRFKLFILAYGFRVASRYLLSSTHRIVSDPRPAGWEWQHLGAVRADFRTLSDESLEAFRVLLIALAAENVDDVARHLEA